MHAPHLFLNTSPKPRGRGRKLPLGRPDLDLPDRARCEQLVRVPLDRGAVCARVEALARRLQVRPPAFTAVHKRAERPAAWPAATCPVQQGEGPPLPFWQQAFRGEAHERAVDAHTVALLPDGVRVVRRKRAQQVSDARHRAADLPAQRSAEVGQRRQLRQHCSLLALHVRRGLHGGRHEGLHTPGLKHGFNKQFFTLRWHQATGGATLQSAQSDITQTWPSLSMERQRQRTGRRPVHLLRQRKVAWCKGDGQNFTVNLPAGDSEGDTERVIRNLRDKLRR
eukprot:365558-Chlamydomonas_euryale.AAC.12